MPQNDIRPPTEIPDRFLVHTAKTERALLDPDDIYFLEASGGDTLIRLARSKRLRDVRRLHEIARRLQGHGFVRIHDKFLVNLRRVQKLRQRKNATDWELKLEPPVNRVLPISRGRLADVWAALGEE